MDGKIGVVHDVGFLWFLGKGDAERIVRENDLDVLVFGHFHRPFIRKVDDVIYINPGSPTEPLPPLLTKPTVGLLIVTKDRIEPLIIEV